MSEGEWTAGWILSLPSAAILAASAGWSAGQVGGSLAAAAAGVCGALMAFLVFNWIDRSGRRFRLPAFELPALPEPEPGDGRESSNVIMFEAWRRRPTPGELDRAGRTQEDGTSMPAEVIPLAADASAALHDALARLRTVRS